MDVKELAPIIRYWKSTQQSRTIVIDGKRGKGKSQTLYALHEELKEQGIDSIFVNQPSQIRIADVVIYDDGGRHFYKRDFNKNTNKKAAKALQTIRGAITLFILSTPDAERLDVDLRTDFCIVGTVIKHGWLDIEGVVLGPIIPKSLPPSDKTSRQKEFLEAFQNLEF